VAPSFTTTPPMMFTHFMGMNPSTFHNGMHNYDTQSMPWVSNHFPIDMPNMPSPFPSSPWPTYMNPSFGSGGTMAPPSTSSFDRSHVPQPTLTVGGWNLPSYGSSPSHVFSGASTQMGGYSTYYTPSCVSFVRHASSYEHFSHGGSTYILRYFIRRESILWYRLPSSRNPFTWGKHISSLE
jgi:hypothetical protein